MIKKRKMVKIEKGVITGLVLLTSLVLLLSLLTGCEGMYEQMNNASLPDETGQAQEQDGQAMDEQDMQTPEAEPVQQEDQQQEDQQQKQEDKPAPSMPTTYDDVIYNQEFAMNTFPVVKTFNLEEGKRYNVYFETDKQIQFVVYSEQRYNEWQQTGTHTISKATTVSGSKCCETSGTFKFDINTGEGGKYYFVYDDSKLPDKENLPKQGKLMITLVSDTE